MRTGSVAILAFIGAIALVGVAVSFGVPDVEDGVETFDSADAFRQYLDSTEALRSGQGGSGPVATPAVPERDQTTGGDGGETGGDTGQETGGTEVSRTNVQHAAIDEPDIVKTDGETIYISRQAAQRSNITVLDAVPPEEARVIASVRGSAGDWWGGTDDLLLREDTLITIGETGIRGYDVTDPGAPEQRWQKDVNGTVETARMYDGSIYLVVREAIDRQQPCPVRPFGRGDSIIPCTSIYHPRSPSAVDVTYSVLRMGTDGAVEDATSFLGSRQDTVVYMSENGLYLTYGTEEPRSSIMLEFFRSEGSDLLDERAREQLQRLSEYDLSEQARLVEVNTILQAYRDRLSRDERLALEQELENRFGNWTRANMREFVTSGIVRVGLDELEVTETGEVPGTPLNQFSMDEHDGHLRIATTVTSPVRWGDSVNDLYVLDEDLDVTGSVQGMGIDQRIYSVRFLDEEGYIVTYRRIDPFYVLDLSDPEEPILEGELKLPGFSSYLHPLEDDRVLGVGQEDGQVKAVIFDVADPREPVIEDEYRLTDRWSAISESHHAFLQDPRNEVFFLPASGGGYIFSYADGLELVKAVDVADARRAVYIDEYFYVIGDREVVVLEDRNWSRVQTVPLGGSDRKPIVMPQEPVRPSGDTGSGGMETTEAAGEAADRYMRVLRFGAEIPDIDLYQNTSQEWLPENRWQVKDAVERHNPIQYMIEVSEEVPAATYPGYDPTEEELEAAWDLYNRTYEHAREEGWFTYLNGVGDGYQDIKGDRHYHHPEYVDNENNLDPTQPEVLMYYRNPDNPSEQILTGVMYLLDDVNTTSGQAVDDRMGPLSIWHYHQYDRPTCAMRGLVPGEPDPELCPSGIVSTRSPEMLHVWFVDHPGGQLATRMNLRPETVEQPEKMTEQEFKEKMRGR
jgi:uncharacterized secreted protein with C-terminal beta-propeller domain